MRREQLKRGRLGRLAPEQREQPLCPVEATRTEGWPWDNFANLLTGDRGQGTASLGHSKGQVSA